MLRKYFLGYPLRLLGRTLPILGLINAVLLMLLLRNWESTGFFYLIILCVSAILSSSALYIYHIGKKLTVKTVSDVTTKDPRNPVLYLRSFIDDAATSKVCEPNRLEQKLVLAPFGTTEEETIANELSIIGPCIAIGSPSDKLPKLGMARMYLGDGEWQERVLKLMPSSELVVMRAGITEGFLWELNMAVELVSPKKLLILLPFTIADAQDSDSPESDGYIKFREAANEILPKELPTFSVENVPSMSLSAVVSFQWDWTPKVIKTFDIGSSVKESFETLSKRYLDHGAF